MRFHYSDAGLDNTRSMFGNAADRKYAMPACNFNSKERPRAIATACPATRPPAILRASGGALPARVRGHRVGGPEGIDPNECLGAARSERVRLLERENERLRGSAGRA